MRIESLNVKKEVVSGVKWNAFGKIGYYGSQFFVSVILARMLLPNEFGLIGMLAIFTSIATVFINSGLATALVQKKDADTVDYSTVFYYNISIGLLFYGIMFLSSNYIASFYNQPELSNLTKLVALNFVINSFGTIQFTILKKELDFKKINIISVVGVIVAGIIAIFMAYHDYGVYSIVAQTISFGLITNLLYWITSDWRPQLVFSKKSFKNLFGFGSKLLVSSILNSIFLSIDKLIIGKVFSATQLGYFTRAVATRDLPVENTSGILTNIVFPIFSKINNDEDLKRYHLKFIGLVSFLIFPIMIGMAVVAEPITVIMFSQKWLPSVPMLQILCITGISFPVSVILVNVLLAKGKASLFLKLDVYKKIITLIGMITGLLFGFYSFLIGLAIASILCVILNFRYVGLIINTKPIEYLKILMPGMFLSLIMGIAVFGIGFLLPDNYFIKLSVQSLFGFLIYVGISHVLKINDFIYLKNVLLTKLIRKK